MLDVLLFLELLLLLPSCAKIVFCRQTDSVSTNRLYSYMDKRLSDFAWIGSLSECWLSDLGIGRLVLTV